MTEAVCDTTGRSQARTFAPAGKTICGFDVASKFAPVMPPELIVRSCVPPVSIAAGLIEATIGGSPITVKPSAPESVPKAPLGSSTSMVYGPPGWIPLGQPPAVMSVAGVGASPEQVGTTAVMVLASTNATRSSGIGTASVLPLIGALMRTAGAGPLNVLVLWMVMVWFFCCQPNFGFAVSVPRFVQLL